jgi:sterol 3beta-glucosyltransferase
MLGKRANQVVLEAIRALKALGRRSILAFPEGTLEGPDLPPDAHLVRDIPHSWLFPRVAAVVHHGGAGTTGAALRAGRPNVVVPLTADQAFWARRVSRLGAGPPPLSASRITSANLAAAIHAALEDPAITARAREVGRQIAAEDGVGLAVELIGRLIATI